MTIFVREANLWNHLGSFCWSTACSIPKHFLKFIFNLDWLLIWAYNANLDMIVLTTEWWWVRGENLWNHSLCFHTHHLVSESMIFLYPLAKCLCPAPLCKTPKLAGSSCILLWLSRGLSEDISCSCVVSFQFPFGFLVSWWSIPSF